MSIFKAYDVRGIYPKEINTDTSYKIGRALVLFTKAKEVVVGHDMRMSSNVLHNALIEGLTDQGANVVDIGLCSTSMLYFAARNKPAAVMITASHNPAEYNGFKICGKNGITMSEDSGLKKLEGIFRGGKFGRAKKKGKVLPMVVQKEYMAHNLKFSKGIGNLKAVFDFGNGMSGAEFPKLMQSLPQIEAVYLYPELDGRFPNHEANPVKPETLKALSAAVVRAHADIGIATDGDGDRIGFVDEKGKKIGGDIVLAIIAMKLLREQEGKAEQKAEAKKQGKGKKGKGKKPKKAEKKVTESVLYEVRTSWAVKDIIKSCKGLPVLYRAGSSPMKEKMKKDNILVGGEKSGHYFFRDNFFFESPSMALFIILEILTEEKAKGKTISKLVGDIEKYHNSGEINFKVAEPDKTIAGIEKKYKAAAQKVMHIDGATLEFRDWWFNLRKSNTEPMIRLNLEAKTAELMNKKVKEISSLLKK